MRFFEEKKNCLATHVKGLQEPDGVLVSGVAVEEVAVVRVGRVGRVEVRAGDKDAGLLARQLVRGRVGVGGEEGLRAVVIGGGCH